MAERSKPRFRRGCLITALVPLGLCLLLSGISGLTNIRLPRHETYDRLPDVDKARLAEALHIKTSLGESIWPGWGADSTPMVVWNQAYEFLIGWPGTPPGGWTAVPGDTFEGKVYYRQGSRDPQNFAVDIAGHWVGSMASKTEADVFLIETFRDMFPSPLKQIFPYRLLIQSSETQIGGLLHEDFHAFQAQLSIERLNAAEAAHRMGERYQAASSNFRPDLKSEYGFLAQALEAGTDAESAALVRKFLESRQARRQNSSLDLQLIAYERWLEWEEGTAKYIEVNSLRTASLTSEYRPLGGLESDPYFKSYRSFNSRWKQELIQLRFPTGSAETQFYNSGMAEAFLLDRLLPGWKDRIFQPDIFLEDLLQQAVSGD